MSETNDVERVYAGIRRRIVEGDHAPGSRLIGRTLATSGIADRYGVAVLGIHTPDRPMRYEDPQLLHGEKRLAEGDELLSDFDGGHGDDPFPGVFRVFGERARSRIDRASNTDQAIR